MTELRSNLTTPHARVGNEYDHDYDNGYGCEYEHEHDYDYDYDYDYADNLTMKMKVNINTTMMMNMNLIMMNITAFPSFWYRCRYNLDDVSLRFKELGAALEQC
jgi:hypothetical protein